MFRAYDFGVVQSSSKHKQVTADTGNLGDTTADVVKADLVLSEAYYAVLKTSTGAYPASPGAWRDIIADGGLTWTEGPSNGVTTTTTSITVDVTGKWNVKVSLNIGDHASINTTVFQVGIGVNGADPDYVMTQTSTTQSRSGNIAGSVILDLTSGDTVELNIQDSAGNITDFGMRALITLQYIGS